MRIPRRIRRRPAPPEAVDTETALAGLRAVAIYEAAKGLLVFLVEIGLLSMLGRDVGGIAEDIVHRLHMNPDRHLSHAFLLAAHNMTETRLWALAAGAAAYATVRFVEAYGLWHARVWAEWFALLSGLLYLPWEIYKIAIRPNALHFSLLALNLVIVFYMLYIRIKACWFCDEEPEAPPA